MSVCILELKNFAGRELITGRMLNDLYKLANKNFKKAASFAEKYVDEKGNPKFYGSSLSKILGDVLDDMWDLLKNCANADVDSPSDDESVPSEPTRSLFSSEDEADKPQLRAAFKNDKGKKSQRPEHWFFPGFVVFASYYPFLENRSAGCVIDFVALSNRPKDEKIVRSGCHQGGRYEGGRTKTCS